MLRVIYHDDAHMLGDMKPFTCTSIGPNYSVIAVLLTKSLIGWSL